MPLAPPPGIGAPASAGPPQEAPPPPPPPGFSGPPDSAPPAPGTAAAGAGAGGGGGEAELRKEILAQIGQQVSSRVAAVREETESKVKSQLKGIYVTMTGLDRQLDGLLAQLESIPVPERKELALDSQQVSALLSRIEQQWGQELKTLKQELNQTIVAHNHNADLIKAHKDNIDNMTEQAEKIPTQSSRKALEVQQQMKTLDQKLKQKSKQPKLEPLWERLSALETKVKGAAALQQQRFGGFPGVGGVPPLLPPNLAGLAGFPGMAAPKAAATDVQIRKIMAAMQAAALGEGA